MPCNPRSHACMYRRNYIVHFSVGIDVVAEYLFDGLIGKTILGFDNFPDIEILHRMLVDAKGKIAANRGKIGLFQGGSHGSGASLPPVACKAEPISLAVS